MDTNDRIYVSKDVVFNEAELLILYQTIRSPTNNHLMLSKAKIGHSKPKVYLVHSEPTTTKQALAHPEWFNAMKS